MTDAFRPTRRWASLMLAAGVAGCGAPDSVSALLASSTSATLVLLDTSGSPPSADKADVYRQSLKAVGADLQAGDRLIVANAGAIDRSAFRASLDLTVPKSDRRLEREAAVDAAREQVAAQIDTLLEPGAGAGRSTQLLEAIAAGAQAFGPPDRRVRCRLIMLTDGVEESAVVNLTTLADTPEAAAEAVRAAADAGLVPDLVDVEIFVAGAGGGARYPAVERFWRAYATATKAKIAAYGRLPYRKP